MNDTQPAPLCELCGRQDAMQPLFPDIGVVKCPGCGLVFYAGGIDPAALYRDAYFTGGEYRDYLADKPVLQRNFRRRVQHLRRIKPHGRLLELGSAYGFFLELARETWDARGIDIAADAVAYARDRLGVDARVADFLALPDETEAYDVICMWDTIEHLAHPIQTIQKAARWLKPGGLLAVTTGDIGSAVARLRGRRWRMIHPPTHAFYFSAATLSRAVGAAGLVVRETRHAGHCRSYRSMAHGLVAQRHSRWPPIDRLLTLGGRLDFPVRLNFFDIMMHLSQKPVTAAAPPRPPRPGT